MKYGPIQRPEEQAQIEVIGSAANVLHNAYLVFKRLVKPISEGALWLYNPKHIENAYQLAAELLRNHEKLNTDAPLEFCSAFAKDDCLGIFLSAALNQTSIDTLVLDNHRTEHISYRLKPGKLVVLGNRTNATGAGEHGEGYLLNWGAVSMRSWQPAERIKKERAG